MLNAIFAAPCLTTLCRLDELGLKAVGQLIEPDRAVIECRSSTMIRGVARAGGVPRDRVVRRLAREPFGIGPRPKAFDPNSKSADPLIEVVTVHCGKLYRRHGIARSAEHQNAKARVSAIGLAVSSAQVGGP